MARSFAACTYDVGPGEYCQDGWMASYNCPPGYGCNDMASWTCTADDPYGSPAGSGSSRPAPPPLDAGALDAAVPDGATDDATSEDAGDDGA